MKPFAIYYKVFFYYTILSFFGTAILHAQPLVPFALPWDDNSKSFLSRNDLMQTPAGKHGFVQVKDGHFVDGRGQRIRFLGVNTAFDGNFPPHDMAEKVAARMAKFGINAVRFHHLDTLRAPRGIWKEGPAAKQALDPQNLDRLDFFIAQLKKHGIYTNLNLKVGREFVDADGLPHTKQLPMHSKGPDHYVPRLMALQKKYAHDLLTHINPYTGKAYIHEPAVAMVEINNESGLLFAWRKGDLDDLPEFYQAPLRKQWNLFLLQKYQTTAALREAWQAPEVEAGESLTERFHQSMRLNTIGNAQAEMEWRDGTAQIAIKQPGQESWHVQWLLPLPPLEQGQVYQGRIQLKANAPRTVTLNLRLNRDPWTLLDQPKTFAVESDWKTFEFAFIPSQSTNAAGAARLDLGQLGQAGDSLSIRRALLQKSAFTGLPQGQSLEEKTIACLWRQDFATRSQAARRDWIEFLLHTETAYNDEMRKYLKNELQVQSPITGTQLMFGAIPSQLGHDYIDIHGYFHHPRFPDRSWDPENWYVENVSIFNESENVLTQRLRSRIAGYPFTVSEYNHPAPNPYSSEAIPLIAAYGAFQDWDGIFLFAYSHNDDYPNKSINNFFDIAGHTTKMMSFPAAANMFLRGDVAAAQQTVTASISRQDYLQELVRQSGNTFWRPFDWAGLPKLTPYFHQTAVRFGKHAAKPTTEIPAESDQRVSDTGELVWQAPPEGPSHVLLKAEKSKGFIGFTLGTTLDLGGRVYLAVGETINNWANILLSQMDEAGKRWLLTATGYTENAGMQWKNEDKTTVGRAWGEGPPLVEPVPLLLSFGETQQKPRLFALDEHGQRQEELSQWVRLEGDKVKIDLMENKKHLWYEIVWP